MRFNDRIFVYKRYKVIDNSTNDFSKYMCEGNSGTGTVQSRKFSTKIKRNFKMHKNSSKFKIFNNFYDRKMYDIKSKWNANVKNSRVRKLLMEQKCWLKAIFCLWYEYYISMNRWLEHSKSFAIILRCTVFDIGSIRSVIGLSGMHWANKSFSNLIDWIGHSLSHSFSLPFKQNMVDNNIHIIGYPV